MTMSDSLDGRLCGTDVTLRIELDSAHMVSVHFALWNEKYTFTISNWNNDMAAFTAVFFDQQRDPCYGMFQDGIYHGDDSNEFNMIRESVVDIFNHLNSMAQEQEDMVHYASDFLARHATLTTYQGYVAAITCRWITDYPSFSKAVRSRRCRRLLLFSTLAAGVGFVSPPLAIAVGTKVLGRAIGSVAGRVMNRAMSFLGGSTGYGAAQSTVSTEMKEIPGSDVGVASLADPQETLAILDSPDDSPVVKPFPAAQKCHTSMLAHIFSVVKVSTSVLQACPTGTYLMRFAPDIEAGLKSGALVLSKNMHGYTVSVGDGTKLVASGGLVPQTLSATRCVAAVTSTLDILIQWHYLAGINAALQQQSQVLQRIDEDRLQERFGKLSSMEQKLTDLLQDLQAGEDVHRLAIRLDAFCSKVTDALHILFPMLESFCGSVRDLLSNEPLSIPAFEPIVEEFKYRRPGFDMLCEYLRLNVFVQFLKSAVAACDDSSTQVKELANRRLQAAFDRAESLRPRLIVFHDLTAKIQTYSKNPHSRCDKMRMLYRSWSEHDPLGEAASTIESWAKECSNQLDVIAYLRGGKVVVSWNAETCEAATLA
eukprot:GILJ01003051.1.p1 GENE.GILJ01003051.1~~GILJ01003051.1.p1  ORF type:complete len:595 (+),score=57.89 GILJ01003051.1:2333-4117(+)